MCDESGTAQPVEHHVSRIGNLLLLPGSLNSEARIRPFTEKKNVYQKHNLRLVTEVCQETDWTLSCIKKRESVIVEWAKQRWADL